MDRRVAARPQRVLLVDDSADLRAMWRLWLTCWGFAVEEARNGAEAVERARIRPPDLIVMDLAMPVLDGQAAMQLLAADAVTAHVPVLALSAQTMADLRGRAGTHDVSPETRRPRSAARADSDGLADSPARSSRDRTTERAVTDVGLTMTVWRSGITPACRASASSANAIGRWRLLVQREREVFLAERCASDDAALARLDPDLGSPRGIRVDGAEALTVDPAPTCGARTCRSLHAHPATRAHSTDGHYGRFDKRDDILTTQGALHR